MTAPLTIRRRRLLETGAKQFVAIIGLALLAGCRGGPPFNSYDPPPGFAIVYKPGDLNAQTRYGGGSIRGVVGPDIYDPTFETLGAVEAFTPRSFIFGKWEVVQGARWPAMWRFTVTAGCGAGTSAEVEVRRKLLELVCVPRVVSLNVNPGGFVGSSPPAYLTVGVDGVSPGTGGWAYIIDPGQSYVVSSEGVTVGGDGTFPLSVPSSLSEGHYTVVAEFDGLDYGAQGGFDVSSEPPPPPPDPCATPEGHDHWGSCGRTDSCGHVFGSDTECGCPNAPIVYDTCYETVCDTNTYWVDEWCGGEVCQWDQSCGYNEWGEWYCEWYPHDCYWEPNLYVCGGHWETEQVNCREEPYLCNPHQCGF